MLFIVLSLLFGILGLLGPQGFKPAIFLLVVVPFSNVFSSELYWFGLYPYDFYFIFLGLHLLGYFLHIGRLPKVGAAPILLLVLPLIYALAFAPVRTIDEYYLRDFRPMLFGIQGIVILYLLSRTKRNFHIDRVEIPTEAVVVAASISNIVWFAALSAGIFSIEDRYYQQNLYRYADLSTYVTLIYLVFRGTNRQRFTWLVELLALLSVLLSGYRVLIVLAVVGWIIRDKSWSLRASKLVTAAIAAGGYIVFLSGVEDTRVQQSATLIGIGIQIVTRYSPFFDLVDIRDWVSLLIGYGHGQTFEIPWFGYRDNVDTQNNFVDNIYLTFVVKYGAMSALFIVFMFQMIADIYSAERLAIRRRIFLFLGILGFFYCLPFQATAPGLLIGFACVAHQPRVWRCAQITLSSGNDGNGNWQRTTG